MSKINDRSLVDLINKSTRGPWLVASDEDSLKFYIYQKESSPIKYVARELPENMNNYDIRLMSLARELAEEVLEYRIKERKGL